ncbi:MAG: hypothetical protein ACRC7N_08795 [Clostridium sp.]
MILKQMKYAIKSKYFLISIIIGLLILFISIMNQIGPYLFVDYSAPDIQDGEAFKSFINSDIFNRFSLWTDSLSTYMIVIPIIATLAYSLSFRDEVKSGMIKFIHIRMNDKSYRINKIIVNSIISGLSAAIPVIISTIIIFTIFGGSMEECYSNNSFGGMYNHMFRNNFVVYAIFHIIIIFLIGFSYSSIALAVSTVVNNTLAIILSPFVFWLITSMIFPLIGVRVFNPERTSQFHMIPTVPITEVLTTLFVIFIVFNSIFFYLSRKENIYERRNKSN